MKVIRRAGLLVMLFSWAAFVFAGPVLAQSQLVIVSGTDAVTLDVHYITDSPSATVAEHIVEPLLELTPEGELFRTWPSLTTCRPTAVCGRCGCARV